MPLRYIVCLLVLLGPLGACATPKTPDEFRQNVRGQGAYTKFETLTVQRPYTAVVKTIKTQSEFCLHKSFRHTYKQASLLPTKENDMGTTDYIPLSKIGPSKAEFYTKWVDNTKGHDGSDQFIFYVADVTSKGPNSTSIDLYYYESDRYIWARDLVKAWARGEEPGCPKFTGYY